MYLAMYWRAKLSAKAAADAVGKVMGIGKVMGRARNALFSPPIDNGADAVGEAVATAAAGSSMCWLLLTLLVLLLILLPGLMVLHG